MKKKKVIGISIVVIALIIGCVCFNMFSQSKTDKGIAYLQAQEKLKVEDIQEELNKKKQAELQSAVEQGNLDVFSLVDDFVFYGDSRVMGYYVYNLLDANRIFAGRGNTLSNVSDWDEQLRSLTPSNVFISYGVNDMGSDLDNDYEGGYEGLAKVQMNHILEIVPNASIYLCSIIPCSPEVTKEKPYWAKYEDYNSKLQKACNAVEACTYVDVTGLADGGNANIYSGDGIHFSPSFYTDWLTAIVNKMD